MDNPQILPLSENLFDPAFANMVYWMHKREETMRELSEMIRTVGFYVEEAGFATVGDFWKDIVSFWKKHRFYYIESGQAQMTLRNARLDLEPGMLYYIPKNSVITASNQGFLRHYYIHFEADETGNTFLSSLSPEGGVPASPEDVGFFRAVLAAVEREDPSPSGALYLNGLMQIILSRFIGSLGENFGNRNILRFFDIMQYVENNVEKKITVKELAAMANLNEVYFSNCFSKAVGQPPLQYILEKKLQHAMVLLQDERLSIKEIAYRLNFGDVLYFSRLFKRKTKLSPSEFRNLFRQSAEEGGRPTSAPFSLPPG